MNIFKYSLITSLLFTSLTGEIFKPRIKSDALKKLVYKIDQSSIENNLKTIRSFGPRMIGSIEIQEFRNWLESKLQQLGYEILGQQVFRVTMPIDKGFKLSIQGWEEIEIFSIWPNLINTSFVPDEGLIGKLIYMEDGSLEQFDGHKLDSVIVLMDYKSGKNWERAASLGASAVIFLPDTSATVSENNAKFVNVPYQFPRFYIQDEKVAKKLIGNIKGPINGKILGKMDWEKVPAHNLLAFLPATENTDNTETLLLYLNYDASSVIPRNARGGITADNIAINLEILKCINDKDIIENRKQNLLIMLTGAKTMWYSGIREFAHILRDINAEKRIGYINKKSNDQLISSRQEWLINRYPSLVPWMNERDTIYKIKIERYKEAIDWLKTKNAKPEKFIYNDFIDVQPSDYIQYKNPDKWLFNTINKKLKSKHIDQILIINELAKNHGIDLNDDSSKFPIEFHQEIKKKKYYTKLIDCKSTYDIIENIQWSQNEFLDKNDITCTHLIQEFQNHLNDLINIRNDHLNNLSLRDILKSLNITRAFLSDLSSGNQIITMGSASSHSSELSWGIGPIISQNLESMSNMASDSIDANPFSEFDFVDGITFNASKKRKAGMGSLDFGYPNIHLILAGVSTYAFGTGNDNRGKILGPGEIIDINELSINNLEIQAQTLALIIAHALKDPSIFPLRTKEIFQSTIDINGRVVQQDIRSGPFADLPLSGAIVTFMVLPEAYGPWTDSFTGSVFDIAYDIADKNGNFSFQNVPAEAWKRNIISQSIVVKGFGLNRENGMLKYAPSQATSISSTNAGDINLMLGDDVYLRLIVFDGVTIQLHGSIDPMRYQALNLIDILDASGGGLENYYIHNNRRRDNPIVVVLPEESTIKLVSSIKGDNRIFLLGNQNDKYLGQGFSIGKGFTINQTEAKSAENLFYLNKARMKKIKSRGIKIPLADRLHAHSEYLMDEMKKALDQNYYTKGFSFARDIWGHELRIYPEIKKITDAAVLSVMILIAFLVPWAYFLERIIIQSKSINGQLGGFLGFFTLGTSFIYFVHPAFQLSMSPLMILIAYSLGGMALLALNIIFKKYKSVIKQWRIRIGGIHSSDISRSSAFAMAFNLGLTSMAKRPLRTSLIIIMVSLLVFSVNTFISVETYLDTKFVPIRNNAKQKYNGILYRQPNWSSITPETESALKSDLPKDVIISKRTWIGSHGGYSIGLGMPKYTIKNKNNNKAFTVNRLQGFTKNEPEFSDLHHAVNGKWFSGTPDEIILPQNIADALEISFNDINTSNNNTVFYKENEYRVIGILDTKAADSITDITNNPLSMLDYISSGIHGGSSGAYNPTEKAGTEKNPVFYSFNESFLFPIEAIGGDIKIITAKFPLGFDLNSFLKNLMGRLDINIFTAINGESFLIKTASAQSITGLWKTILPLFLVMLIMVNTMLGTIDERQEEIKMLGAVGLSPSHISTLYFAESSAYGIFGVVFGAFIGLGLGMITKDINMGININYASLPTTLMGIVVMSIVILASTIPARVAARQSTPLGIDKWKADEPEGNFFNFQLPFTLTHGNGLGVLQFIHEYLNGHWETTSSNFRIGELENYLSNSNGTTLTIKSKLWLEPYDMRVSQYVKIDFIKEKDERVFKIIYSAERLSGDLESWAKANYLFLDLIRKQFLIFRTLSSDIKKQYLQKLEENFSQKK